MQGLEAHIVDWIARYGYGAASLAVVSDPAGIPWAWVFVMLLAAEAGKSVVLMLLLGFATLFGSDLLLYFIGWKWGTQVLDWLQKRRPTWSETLQKARSEVCQRAAFALIIGRYLPVVGRWAALGAGMARVPPLRFALLSLLGTGGLVFGFGVPAHFLGRQLVGNPLFFHLMLAAYALGVIGAALAVGWRVLKSRGRARPTLPDGT